VADEQEIEEMERMRLIAEMNFLRDESDSRTAELERQLKSSNDEVEASRQVRVPIAHCVVHCVVTAKIYCCWNTAIAFF
jgi:hypothetical protein